MRKIYSLVLIAAGLLIGTQGWAEIHEGDVCKIGDNGYATLQDAFDAVPTTNDPVTIEMIADVIFEEAWTGIKYNLNGNRSAVLDLNGHTIFGTNTNTTSVNNWLLQVQNTASLTIMDTQAPENPKEGTGILKYHSNLSVANTGGNAVLIRNEGHLTIKSGCFIVTTPREFVPDACFCVDNYGGKAVCTIENGYFYNTYDCLRNYANDKNNQGVLNILGGKFEGGNGIVFVQSLADCLSEINISGGDFTSGNRPLVRVWTNGGSQLDNLNINISGGIANVDALYLQHNTDPILNGKNTEKEALDEMLAEFYEKYGNVFNITGGTFASENYQIVTNVLVGGTGGDRFSVSENVSTQSFTLPTLLEGAKFKMEEQDGKMVIVSVVNKTITDANQLNNEEESATIAQDITIAGCTEAKAYNVTVKSNATLTIQEGAILTIGQGGITVEAGSHIIVEAGGILRIGDRGFVGTGADALIVKTDLNKSGIVSISPSAYLNDAPQLTIHMTSRGYTDAQGQKWQFFAIPTKDASLKLPSGVQTYMCNYDVDVQDWNVLSLTSQVNEPFRGYIMTNGGAAAGNVTYTMLGTMNGRNDAVLKLKGDASEAENWNFFGNSYLAPVDIRTFIAAMADDANAKGAERTINLYDATKGSYVSITKGAMDADPSNKSVIPPMNAFFMNLRNAASANVLLDYSDCVYGNEVTTAMYAPTRQQVAKVNNMKITIAGETNIDNIRLFEGANFSEAFDNDYEATKMMNDGVNVYAELNNSKLAAVANSNLDGTQLHFQADNAVEYTMTISNNNCDGYVLVDHLTNAQVAMTDGATYTFVATPNETTENRFEIRKAGGVVTNLAEMKAAHAVKGIYTAAGQYVGKADRWSTLPAGMYIVDGVRMAK